MHTDRILCAVLCCALYPTCHLLRAVCFVLLVVSADIITRASGGCDGALMSAQRRLATSRTGLAQVRCARPRVPTTGARVFGSAHCASCAIAGASDVQDSNAWHAPARATTAGYADAAPKKRGKDWRMQPRSGWKHTGSSFCAKAPFAPSGP